MDESGEHQARRRRTHSRGEGPELAQDARRTADRDADSGSVIGKPSMEPQTLIKLVDPSKARTWWKLGGGAAGRHRFGGGIAAGLLWTLRTSRGHEARFSPPYTSNLLLPSATR